LPTEKDLNRVFTRIRSITIGPESIKVVYLGELAGFHYGKIVEARARYVASTRKPFPFPKNRHCVYRIEDEDFDSFTVSEDGIYFEKGWYPLPNDYEVGASLFSSKCILSVEDHPIEDMFGTEIQEGDTYYVLGDQVVLDQNMDDYILEILKGEIHQAKSPSTAATVKGH